MNDSYDINTSSTAQHMTGAEYLAVIEAARVAA